MTAGLATGAYHIPHLQRYNERLRIGGGEVDDAALIEGFEAVEAARGDVSPDLFRVRHARRPVAHGARAARRRRAGVGLGGRLDAVNVVDADVAALTSIDIDHEEWLGADRESIGREKAGIFRAKHPAICGDLAPPASVARARACGAELLLLGAALQVHAQGQGLELARAVDCNVTATRRCGAFQLSSAIARSARSNASSRAGTASSARATCVPTCRAAALAGRFRVAGPALTEWIFDVGHNAEPGALATPAA